MSEFDKKIETTKAQEVKKTHSHSIHWRKLNRLLIIQKLAHFQTRREI